MTLKGYDEKVFSMKRFIVILIFILNFQTIINADDIKEFEINGISIGDNLFDYYSEKAVKKAKKYKYPGDGKFGGIDLKPLSSSQYEMLQFHYNSINYNKSNKKKIIVDSIVGAIFYPNINDCYTKKDEIVDDIKNSLSNYQITYDGTYEAREDTSGESTMTGVILEFTSGEIGVTCSNYSKEFKRKNNYENNLRVDISTKEFSDWLRYTAYE